MKKLIILSTVLVLVLFLVVTFSIVGCKATTATAASETTAAASETTASAAETTAAETQKVKITYVRWTQPPYDDMYLQFAKDFMAKNPNVEIEILFYPDPDMPGKVRTAIASGGALDCFSINSFESAWFMANNTVEEIMPSAFGKQSVQEVVDMWEPGSLKTTGGFYNDKYYGIPEELSNYGAWINTAYMKEAGLDPVKDIPTTWDEFVNVAKKMTVKKGGTITRNGFATNLKASVFPFLILSTLMEQKGLDWSTEQGLLSSLDKPEAVEALKTLTGWATTDGIWDPGLFNDEREGFGNGLTATFLTGGSWYWGVAKQYSVKPEDIIPFKYPRFADGKDIGGTAYGYSSMVTKQSKNKEWAWKWVDYMASFPDVIIAGGLYQPRKTLDPALVTANIPNSDVFVNELPKGTVVIASTKYNEVKDAVGAAIDRVISQGMSNEDSIKQLKDDVTQILAK